MKTNIISRTAEKKQLQKLLDSNSSEFLAIYGRRRIGKTFLISEFFKDEENVCYLEFLGLKNASDSVHREKFIEEVANKLNDTLFDTETESWTQVFRLLEQELNKIENKRIVIFIDELPRFCQSKSIPFLEHLAHFWEHYLLKRKDVILVVSGSSASWMIEHVIDETATLYDRITDDLELKQLKLDETKIYLKSKNINLEDKSIAELYMAFGGIPKYLDYIQPDDSAHTAINRLFFKKGGKLRIEFSKLFKSLYQSKANQYKEVLIKSFSTDATIGKTMEQIVSLSKNIKVKDKLIETKTINRIVDDLVACGFILKQEPFKKTKGDGNYLYFIVDSYCIFYIYWILNKPESNDTDFWLKQLSSQTWTSWKGFAFESICLNHEDKIKEVLGISGINVNLRGWKGNKQIDLLLDRSDDCINVCELKFYNKEFTITTDYLEKLHEKINDFKELTKTKKSILTIMITSYGCIKNDNYKSLIAKEITLYDLLN